MDEKLRRWLEGRCRALPDGTWLVEVPVIQAKLAPTFVLPDEAAKETYLTQAVRLGRFHLIGSLVAYSVLLASLGLQRPVFAFVPSDLLDTAAIALAVLGFSQLLWFAMARRAGENFWRWLEELAIATSPAQEATDRRRELRLCRPGWMLVAEASAFGIVAASIARRWIPLRLEGCSRVLGGMENDSTSIAALAGGCFGAIDLFMVAVTGCVAAVFAAIWRQWWRWNR